MHLSDGGDGGLLVLQVDGGGPSPKRELLVSSPLDGGPLDGGRACLRILISRACYAPCRSSKFP